jgi:hypothetical protein
MRSITCSCARRRPSDLLADVHDVAEVVRGRALLVAQHHRVVRDPDRLAVGADDPVRLVDEPRRAALAVRAHLLEHPRDVRLVDHRRVGAPARREVLDRVAGQRLDVARHVLDRPALAVLPAEQHHRPDREQQPLLLAVPRAMDQVVDLALELAEGVVAGRLDRRHHLDPDQAADTTDKLVNPRQVVRHRPHIIRCLYGKTGRNLRM